MTRAERYPLARMIRTTPFHERTSALNETGLWQHWSGTRGRDPLPGIGQVRVLRGPQQRRHLRHLAAVQVPHRGPRRRALPVRHAGARHPPLPALERAVHDLARRARLRARGRRDPAPRRRRVPADVGRAELRLVRRPRRPPGRHDRGGQPGHRRAGGAGSPLARPAGAPGSGSDRAALLRDHDRHHRRAAGDGQPHRLHRRPRVRDLGRRTGRDDRLGCGLGCRRRLRGAAVRHGRAVHAAHRGRAAAPGRRLRLQPVRLQRRASVHAARARLGLDVQGAGGRRPPVHRAPGAGARARREDVTLADGGAGGRLGGLRPGLQRGRTHSAQGPSAGSRGLDGLRRRSVARRLRDQHHVLAGAAAAHRAGARAARPGQARHPRLPGVHRGPPLRAGGGARRAAAPLQPGAQDATDDGPIRRDRGGRRPQRAGQRRLPGQGRAEDADPRAPADGRRRGDHRGAAARASGSRPSATPSRCCGRRSSRSWSSPGTASCRCSCRPASRPARTASTCSSTATTTRRCARSRGISPHDADAYEQYGHDLDRVCQAIKPLLDTVPPDLFSDDPEELVALAALGSRLRGLDKRTLHNAVRLLTGSAADFLDDYFESPLLKGYLASSSIIGSKVGPRSQGSGLVLLFHSLGEHDGEFGSWAFHKDGNGGFTQVLARAADVVRRRDPDRVARRARAHPRRRGDRRGAGRRDRDRAPTWWSARSTRGARSSSWSTRASCPTTWSRTSAA